MASKTFDKLLILTELTGAHRPIVLNDPQYAKLIKALTSSFPEEPLEKEKGYDVLRINAQSVGESVSYFYDTFLQVMEFKDTTILVLCEAARNILKLKFEDNFDLFAVFMDLFTKYIQVQMLLSTISERKQLALLYSMAFQVTHPSVEPNYTRLGAYITDLWVPLKKLQKEFEDVGGFIGSALLSLAPFVQKVLNLQALRTAGTFSLFLPTQDYMQYPSVDPVVQQLQNFTRFYQWIAWGYLVVPQELGAPNALDLLRIILSEGFVLTIFRNEYILLHNEYEALFSTFKTASLKLSNHSKVVKDAASMAVTNSGIMHRARRVFIHQQISDLVNLIQDSPGILAPKLAIVYAALSFARHEIMWYFEHNQRAPPKFGKHREKDYQDVSVIVLIDLLQQLVQLVHKHTGVVQRYYIEYLTGPDALRFKQLVADALAKPGVVDTTHQGLLTHILTQMMQPTLRMVEDNTPCDLEGLRMNWLRCVTAFSSSRITPLPLVTLSDLVHRGSAILLHSRHIDRITSDLQYFGGLKELYYFMPLLNQHLISVLAVTDASAGSSLALVKLLGEFPGNATRYVPAERVLIGSECETRAESFMVAICDRVSALIQSVQGSEGFGALRTAAADEEVATQYSSERRDRKPPGSESGFEMRASVSRLRANLVALNSICTSIQRTECIPVFHTGYVPKEYLRESLQTIAQTYIGGSAQLQVIPRPSHILAQIRSFVELLQSLEDYVEIDISALLREVLQGHLEDTDKSNPRSMQITQSSREPVINVLIRWFVHFVDKRVSQPSASIMYSSARKAFMSHKLKSFRSDDFKSEEFVDLVELEALCAILGMGGIKALDDRLVELIVANIKDMKAILSSNSDVLTRLSPVVQEEQLSSELLKKLKDVEPFLALCMKIGVVCSFRSLLSEAMQDYSSQVLPWSTQSLQVAVIDNKETPSAVAEGVEIIARSLGISPYVCDVSIRNALAPVFGSPDAQVTLKHLPLMLAAVFTSEVWRQSEYRVSYESFTNNAHTLAPAFVLLVVGLTSLANVSAVSGFPTPKIAQARTSLLSFLSFASTIVLRSVKKGTTKENEAMLLVLDKFVRNAPILAASDLEQCVPYTLLRASYFHLFSSQKRERKRRQDPGVADSEL